jgi:dCTP deaminase
MYEQLFSDSDNEIFFVISTGFIVIIFLIFMKNNNNSQDIDIKKNKNSVGAPFGIILKEDIKEESEKDENEKDENEKDENEKDENEKDKSEKDESEKDESEKDESEKDEEEKDETEKDDNISKVQRGILSGSEIHKEYLAGNILIEPYGGPEKVGPNSYDVSLGRHYYREIIENKLTLIDNQNYINSRWSYCEALKWEDILQELLSNELIKDHEVNNIMNHINPEEEIILLMPGQLILAHTEEFIGSVGTAHITTEMKARSSTGRSGISVCSCAGMGDPGYCSRWTMEIKNNSKNIIPLPVGIKIAQIVFITIAGDVKEYAGHYFDKNKWMPEMMLPSAEAFDERF